MTVSNGNLAGSANIGTVMPIDITHTMQDAYLDYAMSVIVSRALPDVRDGLKPVHRRILYAMYRDLNLTFDKPHKKSARIVGEVLGKYHPHGDSAVYDAMVRMAQEFSLRYPLVDGQGNFGSIDGDNAAAMRYTEARLAEISNLMLDDLEKDTVDWHDNFDNTLREPDILPAALPNLLINGSSGIAVGMATNIPPHNLGEVVDALCYVIDHHAKMDEITAEQLSRFIKGPDFPTGGILYRYRQDKKGEDEVDAVSQGYSVGKARLILQAKAHFEEMSRNRSRIVVTELPYQTNKTTLIERIASLARDGKIEGITDLRDESDRTGMRIVIELTRNVDPKRILTHLFKYTPLQQTFGMQMLALVDGQPRLLSLKRVLQLFIQHRQEIIRRRSEFELARARERAHILEGLLKALDILDEVIAVIRKSQRVESARTNLMREFGFTQIQAQAILDMQLRRLAALERKKLQDEHKALLKRIAYLEDLLAHPEKILGVIKEDLLAIKEKHGDARRTQIVDRTKGALTSTDLLPEQDVWVSVSGKGDLRRIDVTKNGSSALKRSGKGSQVALLTANTRDYLYVIDERGQCRRVSIHEAPQDGGAKHVAELTEFSRRDNITAAFSLPRTDGAASGGYLVCVTKLGAIKRIALEDFLAVSAQDPVVMNVDPKDRFCSAFVTDGAQEILLVSSQGKAIRFAEDDVRSMGLAAGGVGGMKLSKGQQIVYAGPVDAGGELLTATEKGFAKRSPLSDYPVQGRNGGGVVTHKPSSKTGPVSAALVIKAGAAADDPVALISEKNKVVVLALHDIPPMGRNVQGKQVVPVGVGDGIAAVRMLGLPPDHSGPNGDSGTGGGAVGMTTDASAGTNKTPADKTAKGGKGKRTRQARAPAGASSKSAQRAAGAGKGAAKRTTQRTKSRGTTTAKSSTRTQRTKSTKQAATAAGATDAKKSTAKRSASSTRAKRAKSTKQASKDAATSAEKSTAKRAASAARTQRTKSTKQAATAAGATDAKKSTAKRSASSTRTKRAKSTKQPSKDAATSAEKSTAKRAAASTRTKRTKSTKQATNAAAPGAEKSAAKRSAAASTRTKPAKSTKQASKDAAPGITRKKGAKQSAQSGKSKTGDSASKQQPGQKTAPAAKSSESSPAKRTQRPSKKAAKLEAVTSVTSSQSPSASP